ncbi:hypothetical protein BC835DRAFT_1516986 [Cytidiella melzeri]|nr:hypothetical protein BC835DRAFT_1516986 [Cytidiella melzeri]
MATVPPELFQAILYYVGCDEYYALSRSPQRFDLQESRNMLRHLASCSLTCVYWAHACRPKLFEYIRVQKLDDWLELSSLILNTPQRFTPVSAYIRYVLLVQRLDERSWLHTLSLQPSYDLGKLISRPSEVVVDIAVVGLSSVGQSSEPLTLPRLFADLPSLPPHILRCHSILLQHCHFRSSSELKTSLLAFATPSSHWHLDLVDCTWGTNPNRVTNTLPVFAGPPLRLTFSPVCISALGCSNNVELAWAAFTCRGQMDRHDTLSILLHSSDQRVIYEISHIMHQSIDQSAISAKLAGKLALTITKDFSSVPAYSDYAELSSITNLEVWCEYKQPLNIIALPESRVGLRCKFGLYRGHDRNTPIHVAFVDIFFPHRGSGRGKNTTSTAYAKIYPWEQMVDLLDSLQGLVRLRINFDVRRGLVQFVEARRTVLDKLKDRIEITYMRGDWKRQAVDFVTLEDIGKRYVHSERVGLPAEEFAECLD